jgi:hypothetical protein
LSALWRTAAWQETVRWFRVDIFSFFFFSWFWRLRPDEPV